MRLPRWSLLGPLGAPALAAIALAGCGGSSTSNGVAGKPAPEIVAAAKLAADGASSVHVSGSIVSGTSPISLDLEVLAGRGGKGQLSEGGLAFDVIHIGETAYIKGSAAFYRHIGGGATAQLLQGRWLKAPARSGSFASVASLTDLRELVDKTLAVRGPLLRTATTTVAGKAVVGVTDASKGGVLYVATTGPAYPVEIVENGSNGGTISFDRWDRNVSLSAPANAIELSQLQSGQ